MRAPDRSRSKRPRWRLVVVVSALATLVACEAETCREKRTSFACDEGFALTCGDLESTDDPVCTCAGERALDDTGACRARDLASCCACLSTGDADGACTSLNEAACAETLDAGQLVAVDEDCRASACDGPCWFLVAADAGS